MCVILNNKMKRKAQQAGQIMIYVLAIVIVAVILIFGYKSITDFKDRTEMMVKIEFQNKLESSIKSISSEYGTSRKVVLDLTTDYKQTCFVRNYKTEDINVAPKYNDITFEGYPMILDNIDHVGAKPVPLKNVFLIKDRKEVAESYDIGNIMFKQEGTETPVFKCFNVTFSKLNIKIEGKGNYAIIS